MMWNSFLSSYRFITKSKSFTVINLIGLVAGLTAAFLLLAYLINEFSFNSYHQHTNRIFRVIMKRNDDPKLFFSPFPLAPYLTSDFRGIQKSARLVPLPFIIGAVPVSYGNKQSLEQHFYCADPDILGILSFTFIAGNPSSALNQPNAVILSEQASQRFFGNLNPLNQILKVSAGNQTFEMKVTGLFRDLPWNSTLDIDFVANMSFLRHTIEGFGLDFNREINSFTSETVDTYFLLDKSATIDEIESQTATFLQDHAADLPGITLSFLNIEEIYLNSNDIPNDFHRKGNKTSLLSYSLLAIFILILAGINYSLLSSARSSMRFKEIGVRKVLGATTSELQIQLITESVILTFIAFPLSFLLLGILEPFVADLYGYPIRLYSDNMIVYIPIFAGITLLIGLLSGSHTAMLLSSLSPLNAFKHNHIQGRRFQASKFFIVFQLFITISLLSGTLIIYSQLSRCINRPIGIEPDALMRIPLQGIGFREYLDFKKELSAIPGIVRVSGASIMPPENASIKFTLFPFEESHDSVIVELYKVDFDFFNTLGIQILSGRDFDRSIPEDYLHNVILNEEAVRALKMDNPLDMSFHTGRIIGVVNDFSIHSLHTKISPAAFTVQPEGCQTIAIRIKTGTLDRTISQIQEIWKSHFPDIPIIIKSFREELKIMYQEELSFGTTVFSFTLLAFIITGMGLFGLIILLLERRRKEIAIRKVFGASDSSILYRIQKEFFIFLLIASVVSIPVTLLAVAHWLNQFYYRDTMHWWLFAVAILFVVWFVLVIILIRTLIVVRKTPASVLKYE